jgi:hypothetical protein
MSKGLKSMATPIAFFIFRRPEPTSRVFEQIRRQKPAQLIVIADGPREGNASELELTTAARAVVETIDWPCEVTRIYSETNLGLRERILTGLDEVFERVDQAIILEDDCLPNSSFFDFCSQMLRKYIETESVALVAGSNLAPYGNGKADYFFSHTTFIWGWATWANRWKAFRDSPQVEHWTESEIDDVIATIPTRFQKREFVGLMKVAHALNTWDVSLAVWIRQRRFLTVIPRLNLVENIGFGQDATHTKFESFDVVTPVENFSGPVRHPSVIEVDANLEKRMWRVKSSRWLTYPIFHPFEFFRRSLRYLQSRRM